MNIFIKKRAEILICLLITIITLAVYWQIRTHEFVSFDDDLYVTENQQVRNGLSWQGMKWGFGFTDIAYWHPLTWLSHMLDCQLFGLHSGMHHVTNLILHIANSLLLFILFMRMTNDLWKSSFLAALFAVHPMNVETIAWVAERKNILSTFFWILAMLTYFYYTRRPGLSRYLMVVFVYVLGLLAKPMLVTLPFVLLLLDYWPLGRFQFQRSLRDRYGNEVKSFLADFNSPSLYQLFLEKVPFFALAAVSIYLSFLSLQHHGIVVSTGTISMKLRVANALFSYMSYIGKMVWPVNLAVFYPFDMMLPVWLAGAVGVWLVSMTFWIIGASKARSYLAVGWLWYLGTLVPVIGLMQGGLWPAMADRWAYVPLIGLFIMIAWGLPALWSRWSFRKSILVGSAGVLILVFMIISWMQVKYWQNSITLYRRAVEVTFENDVAHNNLGVALFQDGKKEEAIVHFIEALRVTPGYQDALKNLNTALAAHLNLAVAIIKMQKLQKLFPEIPALSYNLGNLYNEQGKLEQALYHYQSALSVDPGFIQAMNNLAFIYVRRAEYEKAHGLFKKMLEIQPDSGDIYYDIACLYAKQNKVEESIHWLKKAIKKGYTNWDIIKTDKNLENVRSSSYFQHK